MERKKYPGDLTDEQWEVIKPLIPQGKRGPKRQIGDREIINAILYVNRTGCQRRALPHDFPKWDRAANYFYRWKARNVWKLIHDALVSEVRLAAGEKRPQAPRSLIPRA